MCALCQPDNHRIASPDTIIDSDNNAFSTSTVQCDYIYRSVVCVVRASPSLVHTYSVQRSVPISHAHVIYTFCSLSIGRRESALCLARNKRIVTMGSAAQRDHRTTGIKLVYSCDTVFISYMTIVSTGRVRTYHTHKHNNGHLVRKNYQAIIYDIRSNIIRRQGKRWCSFDPLLFISSFSLSLCLFSHCLTRWCTYCLCVSGVNSHAWHTHRQYFMLVPLAVRDFFVQKSSTWSCSLQHSYDFLSHALRVSHGAKQQQSKTAK